MHVAARQGNLKLMKTYVEQGAELETKDDIGVILYMKCKITDFVSLFFSHHKSFRVRQGEPGKIINLILS